MTPRGQTLLAALAAFVFGLASVLGVAAHNLNQLVLGDIVRSLFVLSISTSIIALLIGSLGRGSSNYALIFAIALGAFLQFQTVALWLSAAVGNHAVLAALILLVTLLVFLWLSIKRGHDRTIALAIVAMAVTTASVPIFQVTAHNWIYSPPHVDEVKLGTPRGIARLPDIIYLVPDRYGSESVLAETFQFDNAEFYRALRSRGFFVANEARSNYLKTFQSLASSLNLQYLDSLRDLYGPASADQQPVFQLLQDNLVQKSLRSWGYRYIHLGGWWRPTQSNPNADENFSGRLTSSRPVSSIELTEFEFALLARTPLPYLLPQWNAVRKVRNECERLKQQLEFLSRVGGKEQPTFVFAHLMIPHSPVVINANGECIPPIDYPSPGVTWKDFRGAYANYVRYLNTVLLGIFDAQQKRNPNGVIFVVQSDEGPFPERFRSNLNGFDWTTASAEELRMKFGIMNAIYFPSRNYDRLYSTISPVNNWRAIFSELLGEQVPFLEDRSYIFPNAKRIYDFQEITDQLRHPWVGS